MTDPVEYQAEPYFLGMIHTDPETLLASALNIPVRPPSQWFSDPGLSRLTPMTVENNGRVFGHIASWAGSHIGRLGKVKPPRSRSGYKYFRTGQVETDDGSMVPVGQITLVGGHAPLKASAQDAVAHYDNTQSAVMDIAVGEDDHGIWVAGALRPDVDDIKMRAIRASSVSGDWRPIDNALELVAICSVNVPGFPIPRALAAAGDTEDEMLVYALVAAGTEELVSLAHEGEVLEAVRLIIEDVQTKVDWMREAMAMVAAGDRADEEDDEVWDAEDDDEEPLEDPAEVEAASDDEDEDEGGEPAGVTADAAVEEPEPEPDQSEQQLTFEFGNHLDRETLAAEILAAGDAGTLWSDGLPMHFSTDQVEAVALRLRVRGAVQVDSAPRREAMLAGAAMPSGRFPITSPEDLRRAVLLVPEDSSYAEHIERRAQALGVSVSAAKHDALVAAMESLTASADKYDAKARRRMAKSGSALPDGSFPIADEEDLHNAIQALGRAKDAAKARAHVMKRARALNLVSVLPEKWSA